MKLLLVGVGGALGSMARYLLEGWVQRATPGTLPSGTLAVNVLGSFALGLTLSVLLARGQLDSTLRLFLATGVLGGFTTYSGFNHQALELLRARAWLSGSLTIAATVGLCLLAGGLGLAAGRWLDGPA
jgi:CrcB protein